MNKFEIVNGKRKDNNIMESQYSGVAIYKEDENLYKIHLSIFPNITYFMQRNRNNELFTIFSKKIKLDTGVKLLNPVGHGMILDDLKTHMMLSFRDLRMYLYMSLFPNNKNLAAG